MFTGKRLLVLGFILLLLIATPATVYFVQKQQEARTHAQASTTMAFYQDDALTQLITQANPVSKNVGDVFPVTIGMDPGTNLVASVILHVKYDPTKLEVENTTGTGTQQGFVRNTAAFGPDPIEGPKYTSGEVAVWITTGTDVTTAIQAPNKPKVGTITFKALAGTGSTPTQVTFTNETQVNAWGSNATAGENVLSTTQPAFIVINGAAGPTATPTSVPGATATPAPVAATATPATIIATATPAPVFATATPTLEATGPGETMLGMGAIAGVIMLIGAALFFVL